MPFVVERWESGLEVTFDGQPPLRFLAQSATRLTAVGPDAELEVREGRLIFHQGGAELDCIRE
jgi:hypothetical protein